MKRFWDFEELELCTNKDAEHEEIERIFEQTHYQHNHGRHVVIIPLKSNIKEIGSSRQTALRRFHVIENKYEQNSNEWKTYVEFMNEYEHVVFDGSCKTNLGISLNEAQHVGPKLQNDLHTILTRFRRHKYAVSADIVKMYRQIQIDPTQWNLQRIFFRENKSMPIKEYQLTVARHI